MYVIARLLCPYSSNGRVYPSGLIEKITPTFIGKPIIMGHTSPSNPEPEVIGKIVDAVYDDTSRCAIGLIELFDEKLTPALKEMIREKKVAFSIEGEAGDYEQIGNDIVVKELKISAVALVPEPGVAQAKPLVVSTAPIELVEALQNIREIGGSDKVAEYIPSVNSEKETTEQAHIEVTEQGQDGLSANGYAGPVNVQLNVNVNVVGREQTESKVQSQKGEEEDIEAEGGEGGDMGGKKLQVQKGSEYRGPANEEKVNESDAVVDEECVDEACKKRKKKEEAGTDEGCVDEACKKKKKKEEIESDEECVDEACKKKKKKEMSVLAELPKEILEQKLKELLIEAMAQEILEEAEAEFGPIDERDDALEFAKAHLELVQEANSGCDEECLKKCQALAKKYGIPCVLDKIGKPRHPDCMGNEQCCDPVNGFWPIDRAGRAKIAVYLMTRHWAKMARRYGLKGWAKVVDCIVKRAKKYGVEIKCSTLKERTPNIWNYLSDAKKYCVAENSQEKYGDVKVSEAQFVKSPELDVDTAFIKLTESLASGKIPIAEDLTNANSILFPIARKIQEFTREGKLWGKVGKKFTLNKDRMVVGAPIEIPIIDYRFDVAPDTAVDSTYPPDAPVLVEKGLTTVEMIVKKIQAYFQWSDDTARIVSNVGQFATDYLTTIIRNRLDQELANEIGNNATALNYDPNDVYNTAPDVNVADILDAETYLATESYAPNVAIMPPVLLSKLATVDNEIKNALAFAKRIEPGQVIQLLGLNVIVGDKLVTPVVEVSDPSGVNPPKKVAYMYILDDRAVVSAESNNVELAPAYYPERDQPYMLVARKYFATKVIKPDAIAKLAFVVG